MARILPKYTPLFLLLLFSYMISVIGEPQHTFSKSLKPSKLGLKKEKLTHLHFFLHDIVTGPNPTAVKIINSTTNVNFGFGFTSMIDDPLTQGPSLKSKLVGRAQGLYGVASQGPDLSLVMVVNCAFFQGKFNGSTLSILERNSLLEKDRELSIVAGTGVFLFARGYAQEHTHTVNLTSGDAIVECNVFASITEVLVKLLEQLY